MTITAGSATTIGTGGGYEWTRVTGEAMPGTLPSDLPQPYDPVRGPYPSNRDGQRQPEYWPDDPLGTETRHPEQQLAYTLRDWPESPPLDGRHGVIGQPTAAGRGDMEETDLHPERPMRRTIPGSWDEPLFRE